MSRTRAIPTRGFTLVEAVVSMLVVGVMLVASLRALASISASESAAARREIALALAHDLAAEIVAAAYAEPSGAVTATFGPEAGESASPPNRAAFDDIDDYAGWTSAPPTDRAGDPIPGTHGYERRVTVEQVSRDDPGGTASADVAVDSGIKRVTVEVVAPGANASVVFLRVRDGDADTEPAREGTFVRWVGVTLRLGEDGVPLSSGTTILNQYPLESAP